MSEQEYMLKRILVLEDAVRSVMNIVIETMPPRYADAINRMGWEWDKQLDELDAAKNAAATNTQGDKHE